MTSNRGASTVTDDSDEGQPSTKMAKTTPDKYSVVLWCPAVFLWCPSAFKPTRTTVASHSFSVLSVCWAKA